MARAERCPVCKGAGIVNRERPGGAIVEYNITCYGCSGRGWITVIISAKTPNTPSKDKEA